MKLNEVIQSAYSHNGGDSSNVEEVAAVIIKRLGFLRQIKKQSSSRRVRGEDWGGVDFPAVPVSFLLSRLKSNPATLLLLAAYFSVPTHPGFLRNSRLKCQPFELSGTAQLVPKQPTFGALLLIGDLLLLDWQTCRNPRN
ncbi:hypothetical protein NE237_021986 [Protea cynaroides]|uniref:Uncharacterized protein n=1 Tax=Protea cynaroides TaxID=273540 RepID=A0A9Q0H8T2_9MAGN|nr:hypothetical protein NE237_021986 [Protea cynaroides]